MNIFLSELCDVLESNHNSPKTELTRIVKNAFQLTKDRTVFYNKSFAIRFSSSTRDSQNFSNTVLSLSSLAKFDHLPFFVCLVTPHHNYLFLANSSFLKKISHSSHELRTDNIKGSFNGSDINRNFQGMENEPKNFEKLFAIHTSIGFDENVVRLVASTNDIHPTGLRYTPNAQEKLQILESPRRSKEFLGSKYYEILKQDLDRIVENYSNEILLAGLIENVNVRGRIIEYLVAGEDNALKQRLLNSIRKGSKSVPAFKTKNELGDYQKSFDCYETATDIKTKIMFLNSNPKAYNIDKMLKFLGQENTVFLFYFIGITDKQIVGTSLVSIFQTDLLQGTIILHHWAGRNSRGVTQFDGSVIKDIIGKQKTNLELFAAKNYLLNLLSAE